MCGSRDVTAIVLVVAQNAKGFAVLALKLFDRNVGASQRHLRVNRPTTLQLQCYRQTARCNPNKMDMDIFLSFYI